MKGLTKISGEFFENKKPIIYEYAFILFIVTIIYIYIYIAIKKLILKFRLLTKKINFIYLPKPIEMCPSIVNNEHLF